MPFCVLECGEGGTEVVEVCGMAELVYAIAGNSLWSTAPGCCVAVVVVVVVVRAWMRYRVTGYRTWSFRSECD